MANQSTKNSGTAGDRRSWIRFERLTGVMDTIGTVWVFILLIIINLDIFGRALFDLPLRGVPEIVSMSIVALVFMQIAHTLAVGRLTRSDVFINWVKAKKPRLGFSLQGLYHLIGAVLCLILLRYSWPFFLKAWRIGEYVGAQGDFMAPVWPVKLIILIGSATAAIQFFILAYQDLRAAIDGSPTPPTGVP